jgi:hypothetical protein
MAEPKPEKAQTHCMMVLPDGLRRISEPKDEPLGVRKSGLARLVSKLAALRP